MYSARDDPAKMTYTEMAFLRRASSCASRSEQKKARCKCLNGTRGAHSGTTAHLRIAHAAAKVLLMTSIVMRSAWQVV